MTRTKDVVNLYIFVTTSQSVSVTDITEQQNIVVIIGKAAGKEVLNSVLSQFDSNHSQ